MVPPLPWTDGKYFKVCDVSPEARFVITSSGNYSRWTAQTPDWHNLQVWDRRTSPSQPLIVEPIPRPFTGESFSTRFSGNQRTLAVIHWPGVRDRPCLVMLFDLTTAQKTKTFSVVADRFLFSPDGELLYFYDDALRDMESGLERYRVEASIDGYKRRPWLVGDFAVYRKAKQLRIYSVWSNELKATIDIPTEEFVIDGISADCRVLLGLALPSDRDPKLGGVFTWIDTSAKVCRTSEDYDFGSEPNISRNGRFLLTYRSYAWPAWLANLWPFDQWRIQIWVKNPLTNEVVASFAASRRCACFSQEGDQLVVQGDDDCIRVYDLPVRKSWPLIITSAFLAASCTWCLAWLRSRRRVRVKAPPQGLTPTQLV
jgi:WD40 repeat protein